MLEWSIAELHDRYMQADNVRDIIFYGYLYQERKCFGLDYNDLIVFTLYVFERFSDICLTWQQRLEYIMIDEFQDIDALQYRLMEVLQGYHKNLFVVGDPDQTIYSWRGADVKLLLDFDKRFPGTRTIMMLENHRSVPQVLAVANSVRSRNHMRILGDFDAARRLFGPPIWSGIMPYRPRPKRRGSPKAWPHCMARGLLIAIWRCCIARIMHRGRSKRRF